MSIAGWLALGAAIALLGSGSPTAARVEGLVVARRLRARPPNGSDSRSRVHSWPVLPSTREAARRRALLAALRLLVAEIGSGTRPADALSAAAAMDQHHVRSWQRAAEAQRVGKGAAPMLRADADLAFVGHAWDVAGKTGAAPAEVLRRAATDLAARDEQSRAVDTALAGARASAAIMAVLPALGCVLGTAMGARPVQTLFGTPGGRVCLLIGLAFDVAGVAWTARIARRASVP